MKKAEPDGEEKVESSENLLQLLSLLAALQEEEDDDEDGVINEGKNSPHLNLFSKD